MPNELQVRIRASDIGRKIAGGATILACLVALICSGWLVAQTKLAGQQPNAVAETPPLAQDMKALQEESQKLRDENLTMREESAKLQAGLEGLRREGDGFRWLLTVIVGLGALYSLFQGAYSYLNVQELKSQAKTAIDGVDALRKSTETSLDEFREKIRDKAVNDVEKIRTDLIKNFPMFSRFEAALGQISARLERLFTKHARDKKENFYQSLDNRNRQEIYYYEKSAAWLEFVDVSTPSNFAIFRGFIWFYRDKYAAERDDEEAAQLQGTLNHKANPDDLDRAEYYIHRLDMLLGKKDFRVFNERGYMALRAQRDLGRAADFFKESLMLESKQQCAHYNLARIDHINALKFVGSDQHQVKMLFESAVKRLESAQGLTNWEDSPDRIRGSSVDYNLACGRCRLAELAGNQGEKDDLLAKSFEALKASVEKAAEARTSFEQERKPGRDLATLYEDPNYKEKLDELALEIRKA